MMSPMAPFSQDFLVLEFRLQTTLAPLLLLWRSRALIIIQLIEMKFIVISSIDQSRNILLVRPDFPCTLAIGKLGPVSFRNEWSYKNLILIFFFHLLSLSSLSFNIYGLILMPCLSM